MKAQQILNILNVQANKYTQERAANIANIFKLLSDNKNNIESVKISNFGCIENFGAKVERWANGKERILYTGYCDIESIRYTVKINFEKSTGEYNFLIPAKFCPQFNSIIGIESTQYNEEKNNAVKFEGDIYKEIKKALKLVCDVTDWRPFTSDILLNFENGFCEIVYTNCNLLSISEKIKTNFEGSKQLRIEAKYLKTLSGFELEIKNGGEVFINGNEYKYTPDGNYPNYKAVIPEQKENLTLIDTKKAIENLKKVTPHINKITNRADFHFNGSVEIKTECVDFGTEAKTSFNYIDKQGIENFDISLNIKYFDKILKSIDSKQVLISYDSDIKPVLITGDKSKCLLMPIFRG